MDGDINIAIDALAFSKMAIGRPGPCDDDPTLLRGQGRHTGKGRGSSPAGIASAMPGTLCSQPC
jgi:hypothetical protein